MLYGKRKRLEGLAAREASGQNLWTKRFSAEARAEIHHASNRCTTGRDNFVVSHTSQILVRNLGLRAMPEFRFTEKFDAAEPALWTYFFRCDDEEILDVIEALTHTFHYLDQHSPSQTETRVASFHSMVGTVLRERRISYDLIDFRMVPFESREMHVSITAPTLSLLGGRVVFDKAESAYTDALRKISHSQGADAITDAARALQEVMRALGVAGGSLGDQIKDARTKGLTTGHDARLTQGIENFLQWASADRNNTGDSHFTTDASVEDAWLAVHVTGALILRLASGAPRGASAGPA